MLIFLKDVQKFAVFDNDFTRDEIDNMEIKTNEYKA